MESFHTVISADLTISDVEQQYYNRDRIQFTAHPEEPIEYTYARVIAAAHSMPANPQIGPGWFDRRTPDFRATNAQGDETFWGYVGIVDKKLNKTVKRLQDIDDVRFYFFNEDQIAHFCHSMRGSKENWVDSYKFYLISEGLIDKLTDIPLGRRITWDLNFLEGSLFITHSDQSIEGELEAVDIWTRYQESLNSE